MPTSNRQVDSQILPFLERAAQDAVNRVLKTLNFGVVAPFNTFFPWADWKPAPTAVAPMTYTSVATNFARYCQIGRALLFQLYVTGTTGGTASNALSFAPPIPIYSAASTAAGGPCIIQDGAGAEDIGSWQSVSRTEIRVYKKNSGNWGLGTGRYFIINGFYEI